MGKKTNQSFPSHASLRLSAMRRRSRASSWVPQSSKQSPPPPTVLSSANFPHHPCPCANLSNIGDKILPERQAAPDEPHGYDVVGQAHDVLVEPGEKGQFWPPLGSVRKCHGAQSSEQRREGIRRLLSLEPRLTFWAMAEKGDPGQPDLLGGIGVWQGDCKHTCVLLCSKVSVEVGQPGQSCGTRAAIRGPGQPTRTTAAADWHQHPRLRL